MKTTLNAKTRLNLAAVGLAALLASPAVRAANGDWAIDALGNWSVATNWSPAAIPGLAADDAVGLIFDITGARTVTIDTTNRTVGTLNIGDPTSSFFAYTLAASGGARLIFDTTLGTAQLNKPTAANTAADVISTPLALNTNLNIANSSVATGTITISGSVFAGNAGTKTLANVGVGTAGVTLSGVISNGSGTMAVLQDSSGSVLTLSGANTFSGGLTIKRGTVVANVSNVGTASGAAGPSASTITLGDSAGGDASFLANAFTVSNAINLGTSAAGTLIIGANGAVAPIFSGAIALNGNNLTVQKTAGSTLLSLTGGITGDGNLTLDNNGTSGTINLSGKSVNNGGSITNAAGTSSGTTTISGGVGSNVTSITQNSQNGLLTISTTALTVNTNGTTLINNSATQGFTLSGGTTGAGDLRLNINNAGGFSLSTVAINHFGNITISGGGGGTAAFPSGGIGANVTNFTMNAANATSTFSIANSYVGDTVISAGMLRLIAANVIPDGAGKGNVVMNPASGTAILNLSGNSDAINGLTNSGAGSSIVDNTSGVAATLTVGSNAASSTFSGVLQNSGGAASLRLTKVGGGTLTLSGANTFGGNTLVSAGTLALRNSLALQNSPLDTSGAGAVDVAGLDNLTIGGLTGTRNLAVVITTGYGSVTNLTLNLAVANQTYTNIIAEGAVGMSLTKMGANALTLSGTNSYSGGTVINAGILQVAADTHLGSSGGGITLNGGRLTVAGANISAARVVTVGVGGGTLFVNKNNNFTTSGKLSGSGTLNLLDGGGAGTPSTYNFNSTLNDFTGSIVLNNAIMGVARLDDSTNNIVFNASGTLPGGQLTYQSSAITPLTFGVSGRAIEFNSAVAATITILNNNTANAISISKDLVATGAGAKNLTFNAVAGPTNVFAGNISNGTGGGTVAVTKSGAGVWELGGTNTYNGGTTLSAGTLKTTSTNALGVSNVTVSAGTLVIDAADAMADTAALRLPSATTKNLTMNANDTIGSLFLGGVQQPNGAYTSSGAGTNWMNTGGGTLTVGSAASQAVYWDIDGSTPGAGGATPAGTWDASNAFWNALSDGTGSTNFWLAGATAAFAAGTDATGSYTVNVDGTQDIGGLTFEEGSVTLTNGTALRLVSDSVAFVATNRTATIATPITEDATARALTKSGAGTLFLSSTNAHGGGTVLGQGTLALGNASALGTGAFTIIGGGLDSLVADLVISGNNVQNWNGDFGFIGSQNLNLGTGAVTLNANRAVTVSAGTLTVGGRIGGAFSLTKSGAGTLALTGTNAFTGATTVNGGTLLLNGGVVSNSSTLNVAGGGGSLVLTNSARIYVAGGVHYVGRVSSANSMTVAGGTGTSIFNGGGQDLHVGDPRSSTDQSNRVVVAAGGVITNVATLVVGESSEFGTSNAKDNSAMVANGGSVFLSADLRVGVADPSGNDTGSSTSNSMLIADGGIVRAGGIVEVGGVIFSRANNNGSHIGNSLTITNGGQLYSGGTTSCIGWIRSTYTTAKANSNRVTVAGSLNGTNALWDLGGKPLIVGFTTNASTASGNALIVGSGGVVTNVSILVVGAGVASNNLVVLEGGSIYANSLFVTNASLLRGTGIVAAAVNVSGNSTLSPGASVGTLTLSSLTLAGTFQVELHAGSAGDKVVVTDTVDISGATLSVTNLGAVSGSYTILDNAGAGAVTGTFTGWAEGVTNTVNGVDYSITYVGGSGNDVVLTVPGGGPPPPTGYNAFSNLYVLVQGPEGDDDGDGFANLYEYVTGSSPTNGGSSSALSAARTNGQFALRFLRDTNSVDATLIVEGSYAATNDAEWIGFATNLAGSWGSATNVVEDAGNPANVTAFDVVPAATNRFLRLKVTRP